MQNLAPFIAPALALFMIFRRGGKERRVKPNALWIYPLGISILAALALSRGRLPGLEAYLYFGIALAAGAALGWFTTQHVELTLDSKTGTIMSKPTQIGTLLWIADAGLIFVAARVMAQAAHMWLRIRPLLAEHKAFQGGDGT